MTEPDRDEVPFGTESFYRTLVENASEGMLTIDTESRIVYANPAVEEILGYSPSELVGSSKMRIIPERLRPVHAEGLQAYVETGERHIDWDGIELPALHKEGHEVPTLISLREHEHDGERYFTGIIRDISERKRHEDVLRERNERLDEFAEVLSHDIRNPLSVARGYTELAREAHDVPELDEVADALDRMEELIEDVLARSRDSGFVGETEPISLEEALRTAWQEVLTPDAELEIEAELGVVEADRSGLRELFANVLRNAVDHAGADVTVRVDRTDDGFYIEDDGPGLADDLEDPFERGASTRPEGTGYGLAIVQRIANAHGWTVEATETERGARFEFAGIDRR
ncbi:two-component system sensor histidine kinase NtrB [Natronomonas amylolytica]|uniref:two-component system sensor histidine kinase NtrB n=1 Tax=Natronomonas amylolytica TaxID=3108498 RepID=UPI00300B8AA1